MMDDVDDVTRRRLSRRRLLQATVATGVGATAWAAPDIKTLGFKPAAAAVCSAPTSVDHWTSTKGFVGCPTPQPGQANYAWLQGTVNFGPGDVFTVAFSPASQHADGLVTLVVSAPGHRARVTRLLLTRGTELVPYDVGPNQMPPAVGYGGFCPQGDDRWEWCVEVETVPEYGCWPEEYDLPDDD